MSAPHRQLAWTRYLDGGTTWVRTPEEAQVLRGVLMDLPSYLDAQDPGHAQCVGDVNSLYHHFVPNVPEPNTMIVGRRMIDLDRDPVLQLGGAK